MKTNIEIRGLDETLGKVNVWERKKLDAIRAQVKKSTQKISKESKQKAPELQGPRAHVTLRGKKYPRGFLKRAIKTKYKDNNLFGVVHAGKAGYAWLAEHGHNIKGGRRAKAQPYMRSAEDRERPIFENTVRAIIAESEMI